MTETATMMGRPPIHCKVHFTVVGPQAKEFRHWINKEFSNWVRKEFKVKGFCDGKARCSDGQWSVSLEFTGAPDAVLDRLAANFPDLQFSLGHVWEEFGRRFGTNNRRIEYEFTDQNGHRWHGRNGRYERYPSEVKCAPPPFGRLPLVEHRVNPLPSIGRKEEPAGDDAAASHRRVDGPQWSRHLTSCQATPGPRLVLT